MKLWRLANIYWLTCIAYFTYQLHTYNFDISYLGEGPSRAMIAIVMVCSIIMICEFQTAWYLYLKYRKKDNLKKLKLHHKK